MEEFAKKKGKALTRGSAQIERENLETLSFYRNLILGANGIYFTLMILFSFNYYTTEIVMFFVAASIYIGCFQFMSRMGSPVYSGKECVNPGLDLNMKDGMGEHFKDMIILTSASQTLSLLSNYLWLLLLLAPLRGFYMLWTSVIAPWLFAPPREEEVDEKKQKKMDRKLRRQR